MSKTIGPREAALRAQREADNKSVAKIMPKLPVTSGKKPVKRKAKRRPANAEI
jgi:hypothetical protein